jgi:hypothetical protein
MLEQIDGILLRILDIQSDLSSLKTSLVCARLHGTQSGALKASELHPDLLTLYENVEDAEFLSASWGGQTQGQSSDYTINQKGQKVYCDHS